MIFNVTGGGGAALNFKVVGGTSEPANKKENTIWINTSTPITDWVFSATQPTAASGRVWISTGTSSHVEFNALKKNGIQVYPISAKQYVSGAWVDKTAKSYQNGKWVEWITYLYDAGDEYTDLTGGWESKTLFGGFSAKKNTDNIYLEAIETAAGGGGVIFTKNKIALTGDRLILTYSSTRINPTDTILFVSDNASTGSGVAQIALGKTGDNVTAVLDISGLSGSYQVGIRAYTSGGNTNVTVHRLIMK